MKLVSPTGKPIQLRPVHPNRGLMMAYRRKLNRLIAEMQASIEYWLKAAYRPLAMDDEEFDRLQKTVTKISQRWRKQFDDRANSLAKWYAGKALGISDKSLQQALKDAGFSVEFKLTERMGNAYSALLAENVGLIKSIEAEHLQEVEGLVMRSVQHGRNLAFLSKELRERYGITKRRAALISRDQTNKAFAVFGQVRQQEIGITQAIWKHSTAGKKPRPEHVAANGKPYEVDKGMFLEGKWVWPGTEINCRCYSVSVINGFNA